ncbi:MAG: inhibitor of the KinA pathway to sporulation [Parcubacteria group bacterium Gr01-1014_33]|nr:MAG: inhibitor of the KinA pathway to sporulation [Parcubacteria group bacterium Gr01-1014_33]
MFNLPEKIVLFDTEYTTWEGTKERNWSGPNEYREIVQIGAVLAETENFSELDSFSVLIKPRKNPMLSDFFTGLTGIAQETIDKEGVDFPVALEKFFKWTDLYQIYSWGGDADVLEENCGFCGIPFPFERARFSIIQPVFETRGIATKNYMSSTIVRAFGKELSRSQHNALNDARTILDGLRELKIATLDF